MATKSVAVLLIGLSALALDGTPAAALSGPGADQPAASDRRAPDRSAQERRPVRQVRPRVQVTPDRLLYRECVNTTREIWRPYWGYVVTPDMECRWVRR
jgi:hypothetical protein